MLHLCQAVTTMTTPMQEPQYKRITSPIGGLRLYSEDFFVDELKCFGITRRSFRKLCRSLQVPVIEVGSDRLVDAFSFTLALRAISRIGEPNYYAPGSITRRKGRIRDGTTELDMAHFTDNFEAIISELVANSQISGARMKKNLKSAARSAASRMTEAGAFFLPQIEQRTHDVRNINEATEKGIFPHAAGAPPRGPALAGSDNSA